MCWQMPKSQHSLIWPSDLDRWLDESSFPLVGIMMHIHHKIGRFYSGRASYVSL